MTPVKISRNGPIGIITMDRPSKRNALDPTMVAGIHAGITQLEADPLVRVLILEGNGPAFCAGADLGYLQQIADNDTMENLADSERLMEALRAITQCTKPVIAKVHGAAIAGGCGLASVCDIVIAAKDGARFGYSEVGIGFIPALVMVFLLRKVGDCHARRLVLTADVVSADEASRIGLVSMVVSDQELDSTTQSIAQQMAKNSASAMSLSKRMLWSLHGMSLDAGLQYAAAMNALARQTDDCKTGIQNFLTKRNSD